MVRTRAQVAKLGPEELEEETGPEGEQAKKVTRQKSKPPTAKPGKNIDDSIYTLSEQEAWSKYRKYMATRIRITMELMELGYKKAAIKDVYNVRAGFRSTADRVNFTEEAWKKMKPELIRILDKSVRADEEALRIQLTNEQSRRYKKKMARLRTILDAFLSTPVAGSLTREEKLVLSFNQDPSLGIRLMPDIAMRNDSEANTTRDLILHWPQIRERLAQAASKFKQEIINLYPRNRFIWHFPDEHFSPTYAIFHLRCTRKIYKVHREHWTLRQANFNKTRSSGSTGNIILISHRTAFRIHRGMLSRHSDVFRDLFTVPQPAIEGRLFDCPVIHLPESPADLRYLLGVLYDGRKFCLGRDEQLRFQEVEVLVRLAHKYQIYDLCKQGLEKLKTIFTHDFATWNANFPDSKGTSEIDVKEKDGIMAITLAYSTGAVSMLPIAFYLCSNLRLRDFHQGVSRHDGTVERLSVVEVETSDVVGKIKLYSDANPRCSRSPLCAKELNAMRLALDSFSNNSIMSHRSLHNSDGNLEALGEGSNLCIPCMRFVGWRDLQRRRDIWENLPSFFGLDSWEWLRADEAESSTTN
ncbi:hypothetical protein SCP_1503110 [Sparassis crispa]|uniref:BTB domain-containing protein n=1 Tax=Sparassis crispa TaxID=139825 RepID=A0A401H4H5_9APHY|nr:hypothetical protein SCP_1503110 [Sparassis crispa]GBE89303.1 hypothetical protein SCP_1503110 [Sparassis crispa]